LAEDSNSVLSKQIQDYRSKSDDNVRIIHEKQKLVRVFFFFYFAQMRHSQWYFHGMINLGARSS